MSGIILAPNSRQLSNNVRKYQDKIEGIRREARPIWDEIGSLPGFPRKPRKNHNRKQRMQVGRSISVFLAVLQSITVKICTHSVVNNIRPRGKKSCADSSSIRMRCSVHVCGSESAQPYSRRLFPLTPSVQRALRAI